MLSSPPLRLDDDCMGILVEVRLCRFIDILPPEPIFIRFVGDSREPWSPVGIELVVAALGRVADGVILASADAFLRDAL